MVSVNPGQAFLNLGKSSKTDSVSNYCRKSWRTEHCNITGDKQSYYEDCHILQDRFRGTLGPARKGCLNKGYGLPACTLGVRGTAHHNTRDSEGIFLITEDSRYSIFLLIYQIKKGFIKTLKPIQRTLEIGTDGFWISRSLILQVLWMGGSFFPRSWGCRPIEGFIPEPWCEALQRRKIGGKTYDTKKGEG